MVTPVSCSHVDGVRVYQADLPGVCCGTLVFGVGMRDEPVTLSGITHLMEHLLFRLLEPISIEHSAVVSDNSLTVYASGSPEEVGQFFSDFTRAIPLLGEVTEQDLKFEKRIISIEHPNHFTDSAYGRPHRSKNGLEQALEGSPNLVRWSSGWRKLSEGNPVAS